MPFTLQKNYESFVVTALFDDVNEAVVALADGRVIFPDVEKDVGKAFFAHPDAGLLCAAMHPTGVGIVTGGDDGRVVWTTKDLGPVEIARHPGAWIDAIAVASEGQLVAYAAGKKVWCLDLLKGETKLFEHPSSVTDLCFDPKGRKLYCASYNGAYVWFSRIAGQKPQKLIWAGSHTKIAVAPSGDYLITAMQENALHGWRLKDSKDMRMGGYPAKIKSMQFFAKGKLLATSGANGAVVWPFLKGNGPMGEEASEINAEDASMVTVVSGAPEDSLLSAGLDDGRVWLADLKSTAIDWIKREKGSPITALCLSSEANRLIFGDEQGFVYIYEAE
jgi:WD40 repeat protein